MREARGCIKHQNKKKMGKDTLTTYEEISNIQKVANQLGFEVVVINVTPNGYYFKLVKR